MARTIFVSGYCHIANVINVLRIILHDDNVERLAYPDLSDEASKNEFFERIRTADVWITSDYFSLGEFLLRENVNAHMTMLKYPEVVFAAFHPDITYAEVDSRGIHSAGDDYHSAICLWGWKNQIEIDRTLSLFSAQVFHDIGYLDLWSPSVRKLRERFVACDLDFDQFFLPVKRHGVFMHTINHATIIVSVQICMQLAVKLGIDEQVHQEPLERIVPDERLNDWVWPVYPEIGDALGVASSYRWKFRNQHWQDRRSFVEASYAAYERQGVDPAKLSCDRFRDQLFDRELAAHLARTAK